MPGSKMLLSTVLMLLALLAYGLQRWVTSGRQYETTDGKPQAQRLRALGAWRWPVLSGFALLAIAATVLPLFSIAATAFTRTLSGGLVTQNLTAKHELAHSKTNQSGQGETPRRIDPVAAALSIERELYSHFFLKLGFPNLIFLAEQHLGFRLRAWTVIGTNHAVLDRVRATGKVGITLNKVAGASIGFGFAR